MANRKEIEESVLELEKEQKSGKPSPKKKKSIIKYILNISLVLIFTTATIISTFYGSVDQILAILKGCDWRWLLAIVGIMALTMLIRSTILFCFARLFTRKYGFHQALAVDQIGQFYNAVTPSSTGGEIMQAFTYKKQGLHISSAISSLAMYSIVYQSVLIIYNALAFIFKYDLIMDIGIVNIDLGFIQLNIHILVLTIIGFTINVCVILLVLLMGYWRGFHNFVMGPILSFLSKIKIVKDVNKTRENLRIQVENFKIEFRRLITNFPFALLVAFLFAIYMTLRFSIPYFCGLALGNEHNSISYLGDCLFLSNFHQMVSGLIPIPGGAGISEFFFQKLFYNASNPSEGFFYISTGTNPTEDSLTLTKAAQIVWRSITFIVPIIVAGLTTAFYKTDGRKLSDITREDFPDRETYLALQKETYVMRKEEIDALIHTTKLNRKAILDKLSNTVNKASKPKTPKKEEKKNKTPSSYQVVNIKDDEDDI